MCGRRLVYDGARARPMECYVEVKLDNALVRAAKGDDECEYIRDGVYSKFAP